MSCVKGGERVPAFELDPEESGSDFEIEVKNKATAVVSTYHVHKFALRFENCDGVHSKYFAAIFGCVVNHDDDGPCKKKMKLGPDSGRVLKEEKQNKLSLEREPEEAEAFPILLRVLYLGFAGAKLENLPPKTAIALISLAEYLQAPAVAEQMESLVLKALNNLVEDQTNRLLSYLPFIIKYKAAQRVQDKIYQLAIQRTAEALLYGADMAGYLRIDAVSDGHQFSRDVVNMLEGLLEVAGNQPSIYPSAVATILELHKSIGDFEATPLVVACLNAVLENRGILTPEHAGLLSMFPLGLALCSDPLAGPNNGGVQDPAAHYLEVLSSNPDFAGRYDHHAYGERGMVAFEYRKRGLVDIRGHEGCVRFQHIGYKWELGIVRSQNTSSNLAVYTADDNSRDAPRFGSTDDRRRGVPPSWGWKPSTKFDDHYGFGLTEPLFASDKDKKRAFGGFPPIFVKLCKVGHEPVVEA